MWCKKSLMYLHTKKTHINFNFNNILNFLILSFGVILVDKMNGYICVYRDSNTA